MRTYELAPDDVLPIVAELEEADYTARVLHDARKPRRWVLAWTDGINDWVEEFTLADVAFARLALLVAAVNADLYFTSRPEGFTARWLTFAGDELG